MKLLIVGLASDGPSNVGVLPTSEAQLRQLFGAGWVERYSISPTATSVDLQYEPFLIPNNCVNGLKNYLYSPTTSGTTVFFGSIGGSGNSTVDFTYTPYIGRNDLIFAARKYYEQIGSLPYVARIGGTQASLTVQNWVFTARYAGKRYNGLGICWDGTTMAVSGLEPNFSTSTYTGTLENIQNSINQDYRMGISPVSVDSWVTTLTPFSSSLSGGDDGSFSNSDLSNFLDVAVIPVDVTHILLLTPLSSGLIGNVGTTLSSPKIQPRMFVTPTPDYTAPTSSWVPSLVSTIPYRHNMVASVVGDVTTTLDGKDVTRWAAELAMIGFAKVKGFNITNMPIAATNFTPILSETDLDYMVASGLMPLMVYVSNGISVYEGTTTAKGNSFLYSSKVAEIVAAAQSYCWQFFGKSLVPGDQPSISIALQNIFNSIPFLQVTQVVVTAVGQSLVVAVEGSIPGEILTISFLISNKK